MRGESVGQVISDDLSALPERHTKDMGLLRSGLFFMKKGGGQYALEYT